MDFFYRIRVDHSRIHWGEQSKCDYGDPSIENKVFNTYEEAYQYARKEIILCIAKFVYHDSDAPNEKDFETDGEYKHSLWSADNLFCYTKTDDIDYFIEECIEVQNKIFSRVVNEEDRPIEK